MSRVVLLRTPASLVLLAFLASVAVPACIFSYPDVSLEQAGGGGAAGEGAAGGAVGGQTGSCTVADEFDVDGDPASDCWSSLHADDVTATAIGGRLVITPLVAASAWWQQQQGYFLYREVDGPFAVVARVTASQPDDDQVEAGGNGQYKMAGLLVRDAASATERWLKWEVGHREDSPLFDGDPTGMLAGVTVLDGVGEQSLHVQPRFGADVQLGFDGLLGVCRSGTSIYLFSNLADQGWVRKTDGGQDLQHPDFTGGLPETLQVGLITGAYNGLPTGISGRFDFVRFREGTVVTTPSQCLEQLTQLAAIDPAASCDCP